MSMINTVPIAHSLITCAYLILLSLALGRKILSLLNFKSRSRLENSLFSIAIGSGALGYSVFLLGLIGGIRPAVIIPLFIIVMPIMLLQQLRSIISGGIIFCKKNASLKKLSDLPLSAKISIAFIITFLSLYFMYALLPPTSKDAMKYHLRMPKDYIQTGMVQPDINNIFSFFPETTEMLYTLCLLLSYDYSTHLAHFLFGVLSMMTIYMFVRAFSNGPSALLSALAFISIPIVGKISAWAYVDLSLCFYTILSAGLFCASIEEPDIPRLRLSALFMGFALGTKYLAFISLYALIFIYFIVFLKKPTKKRNALIREGLVFIVIAAATASPWYLRNLTLTGNPFFPFFYNVLGGQGWSVEQSNMYDKIIVSYGIGYTFKDLITIPWKIVSSPHLFDGRIGFLFLIACPLLLFSRKVKLSIKYLLLFCALFFIMWARMSQQARFLLPGLGVLCICLCPVFECSRDKKKLKFYTVSAIVYASCIGNLLTSMKTQGYYNPLPFIMGKQSRQNYLTRWLRYYPMIEYINNCLSKDTLTYLVNIGPRGYYFDRPFLQESVFEDHLYINAITSSKTPIEIADKFKKKNITHILIDEETLTQYFYPTLSAKKLNILSRFRKGHLELLKRARSTSLYRIK